MTTLWVKMNRKVLLSHRIKELTTEGYYMRAHNIIRLTLLLLLCRGSDETMAQAPAHMSDPTPIDLQFMTQQRKALQDLAMANLGRRFSGDLNRDLELLQALLDKQLVRPDQVRELQAMGVIIGDLFAAELDMHWIIYKDDIGRSRALRYQQSEVVLFPITMIARRREAGNKTSVAEIYQKASTSIAKRTLAVPYQ